MNLIDSIIGNTVSAAKGNGLIVTEIDSSRPWGGFIRFSEDSLPLFVKHCWHATEIPSLEGRQEPKILVVAPSRRLSLQYHRNRSEWWCVLDGTPTVTLGPDRASLSSFEAGPGSTVHIPCLYPHRLQGSPAGWALIAEIWVHENIESPSGEADIVRLEDDYDRLSGPADAGS